MYKIYTTNYKPFWNNESKSLPEKHVEQIIIDTLNIWIPLDNKVDWTFPDNNLVLSCRGTWPYKYLKLVDSNNNIFYFIKDNLEQVLANKSGIYFKVNFVLDKYMTYLYDYKKRLETINPKVFHVRKFASRFMWNYITSAPPSDVQYNINFIVQKYLGNNSPVNNFQTIRKYVYSTNANDLELNNYPTISDTRFEFHNILNSDVIRINRSSLSALNKNNRYKYIIAEVSSVQAKDFLPDATYIIIPIIAEWENNIYKALYTQDIKSETHFTPLASGNFISSFECDIPPSLFALESINNNKVVLNYWHDGTTSTDIIFFRIPVNTSFKWKLVDFTQYKNGLSGKLNNILINQAKWNKETEPYLLNPTYYKEVYKIDNDKFISTDMSLINYSNLGSNLLLSGLELDAQCIFDTFFTCVYNYGSSNNIYNPLWSNNYSNLRNNIEQTVGTKTPSRENFAANNATTLYTSNQNIKEQQAMDWGQYGVSTANSVISSIFNPFSWFSTASNAASNAAKINVDHDIQNRNYQSQIQNINSSPSTTVSTPYATSFIPNEIDKNGNSLFTTYSNELHDWDKELVFNDILQNGYFYNAINTFNSYNNRKYMNIIHLDTSYNKENLIKILNGVGSIYNSLYYIYEFLTWISTPHNFYKTNILINVTEPEQLDYFNNVEINLPSTTKIDINTILVNQESHNRCIEFISSEIIKVLKELNPQAPDAVYNSLEFLHIDNHNIKVSCLESSLVYTGEFVLYLVNYLSGNLFYDLKKDYLNNFIGTSLDVDMSNPTEDPHWYLGTSNIIIDMNCYNITTTSVIHYNFTTYGNNFNNIIIDLNVNNSFPDDILRVKFHNTGSIEYIALNSKNKSVGVIIEESMSNVVKTLTLDVPIDKICYADVGNGNDFITIPAFNIPTSTRFNLDLQSGPGIRCAGFYCENTSQIITISLNTDPSITYEFYCDYTVNLSHINEIWVEAVGTDVDYHINIHINSDLKKVYKTKQKNVHINYVNK